MSSLAGAAKKIDAHAPRYACALTVSSPDVILQRMSLSVQYVVINPNMNNVMFEFVLH